MVFACFAGWSLHNPPPSLIVKDSRPSQHSLATPPLPLPLPPARRRFQWLFVRIEVELRKLQAYRPELGVLVPLSGHPLPTAPHGGAGGSGGGLEKGRPDAAVELSEKL